MIRCKFCGASGGFFERLNHSVDCPIRPSNGNTDTMTDDKGTWASRERYLIRRAALDEAIKRVEGEMKMIIQPLEGEWHHNALAILREMRDE